MKYARRGAIVLALMLALLWGLGYHHLPTPAKDSRFVKLDQNGDAVFIWHGPWACVLDKETGLVWENKSDDQSIHDALLTFSWHDEEKSQEGSTEMQKGVKARGTCNFSQASCDTGSLIELMNEEKTCGLDSWRLPSVDELSTLVAANAKVGHPKIYHSFFTYTQRNDYWTGTSGVPLDGAFSHLGEGAMAISFGNGEKRALPYRTSAFVRLVASR